MVAMTNMMPSDPDERERVRRVLREHPELERFIERISRHAAEVFPGAEMSLDTRQYDDWDPPIRLIVTAPYSDREAFSHLDRAWTSWLVTQPEYDPSRLFVTVLPHNLHRRTADLRTRFSQRCRGPGAVQGGSISADAHRSPVLCGVP